VTPDGRSFATKLPDFVLSSDEWFRPVALHWSDGCLYWSWYNKIISHNEVPRNHPGATRSAAVSGVSATRILSRGPFRISPSYPVTSCSPSWAALHCSKAI
jgi:hypothetical protein